MKQYAKWLVCVVTVCLVAAGCSDMSDGVLEGLLLITNAIGILVGGGQPAEGGDYEGPDAGYCCTEQGRCPMGQAGAPLEQACNCVAGDEVYAGRTCEAS